ncbi:unnamed protein product [Paramecium pentaurelia]|uniref:Uncharacterized protein n=1 Tax=Paramecium pentaurelia TaxID=43138 RepID=A0A8S1TG41_9CILI|nr:unnamed protein product [Paramecium pentaurelia]
MFLKISRKYLGRINHNTFVQRQLKLDQEIQLSFLNAIIFSNNPQMQQKDKCITSTIFGNQAKPKDDYIFAKLFLKSDQLFSFIIAGQNRISFYQMQNPVIIISSITYNIKNWKSKLYQTIYLNSKNLVYIDIKQEKIIFISTIQQQLTSFKDVNKQTIYLFIQELYILIL